MSFDTGRFFWEALTSRDVVRRRVEVVHLRSPVLRERKISLDLDLNVARTLVASQRYVGEVASAEWLPLLSQPKNLIFDLDLQVDGADCSVPSRFVDAQIATEILGYIGRVDLCGEVPTPDALSFMRTVATEFPDDQSIAAVVANQDAVSAITLARDQELISGEGAEWLLRASNSNRWVELLTRMSTEYILAVRPPRTGAFSIVKLRRIEAAADSNVPDLEVNVSKPASPVTVRIHGVGRARSEHFRVVAPDGMFFNAGVLTRVMSGSVVYTEQSAVDRLVFYTNDAPDGELAVVAAIEPRPKFFATPARILTTAIAFLLSFGAGSEWLFDELTKLSGKVGALAAIAFFIPSALLAYLVKPDDNELRWLSLRPWRRLVLLSLVPLFLALAMLIPDRGEWPPNAVKIAWTVLAAVSVLIATRVWILTRRLISAEVEAQRRQGERTEVQFGDG